MRFQTENGVLIAQANGETLRIEPWGKDSLRVRATMLPGFSGKDWALTEVPEKTEAKAEQFAVDHLEIDGSMGKKNQRIHHQWKNPCCGQLCRSYHLLQRRTGNFKRISPLLRRNDQQREPLLKNGQP